MDKRTLLALALMALVIVITPRFFSPKRPPASATDSASAVPSAKGDTASRATNALPATATVDSAPRPAAAPPPTSVRRDTTPRENVTLTTPHAEYSLANPGAVPQAVRIGSYKDLKPGHPDPSGVTITDGSGPLLRYRIARGADTIQLDTVSFAVSKQGSTITFTSPAITLSYAPTSDGYRTAVKGTVAGAAPGSVLLIDLPSTIRSVEADTADDMRHLAFGYKMPLRDVSSVSFGKLDPGAVRADTGSFQWVSVRTKYWLVALMQPVGAKPAGIFRGLVMRGGPRLGKVPNLADARTSLPLSNGGAFAFDLYVGPQSWQELHAMGNDLENVNPYAGWFHAVVQPFATIVMRVLLWMRATLRVNYGWVLVLFGVGIRLLLWPLNQKAMRTSIQMQRLQPELTEIQKRYKNEPEKQREALVRVYADHGMSPFSPMLGCVPMLLPMPVLFALYFVFQNTIEFRGVSFLWLPDISLRDPLYVIPIVMGLSMFVLSWIGMRASPPNPQAKVMSYMMPAMFTVMFLNFASGLNLYYAAQNIAALPQQWVLTRERVRAGVAGAQSASTNPASRSRRT
ncbi:MAG TPA: YidC/Oxa1 family insertase periplasmic-domain containing protein [Gemmatimonadaceae bacterium]|nr:YidC/Oxa1 family insertase periplasmic-domain containing protein [Gemmatimonadaceae bacterium]